MKVSRDQAERNRAAVVDAASRLFRAQGVEGVAIGEVMREAGLTHGGFYKQFESKDALAAEACALSLGRSAERWERIAAAGGAPALIADYLSARNRDAPETGCALVALGPDAARRGGALATAFRAGMDALTAIMARALNDESRALAVMAQLVGAMVLARSIDDPERSDAILAASRKALGVEA